MNIAILGTGNVGQTIGSKLIAVGHSVRIGSRTATNEKAAAWVKSAGERASAGTFADAAAFGEILFNCIGGMVTLDALRMAGAANLSGKILIDVSNPLDFSKGFPPTLSVCNTDSIGEQIQREFPDALVVKTLNTTNCKIMVEPTLLTGDHDLFMSGNDAGAKATVREMLESWGWKTIIDLGDITTARGTEQLLPIWVRLMGALGTANFNFHIVKA